MIRQTNPICLCFKSSIRFYHDPLIRDYLVTIQDPFGNGIQTAFDDTIHHHFLKYPTGITTTSSGVYIITPFHQTIYHPFNIIIPPWSFLVFY